ncbi:unnamed protein product, partial [Effrenium voratum]
VFAVAGASALALGVALYLWVRQRGRKLAKQSLNLAAVAEQLQNAGPEEVADMKDAAAELFQEATAWVNQKGEDLPTEACLELYALFKQATKGDCSGSRPFGLEAGAKWDAWSQVRGCPAEVAMISYARVLETYAPNWQSGGEVLEEEEEGGKPDGVSMGPTVSTMGCIGAGNPNDTDETPAGQLCEKIANGDFEEACALLRKNARLATQADKDGMLPLHWAADRGEMEMVQFLMDIPEAVAVINAQDPSGDTAEWPRLHYAAVPSASEGIARQE